MESKTGKGIRLKGNENRSKERVKGTWKGKQVMKKGKREWKVNINVKG